MKIKFYADIWPGQDASSVFVQNASCELDKTDGFIRFLFEVDFPTDAIVIGKTVEAKVVEEDRIKISKPPWRKEE